MKAEIWREGGLTSRSYYVYPGDTKSKDAIKDAAKVKKCAAATLKAVTGWVYKDELFISNKAPAAKALKKTVVMTRKG